jgi:hypothetical protein
LIWEFVDDDIDLVLFDDGDKSGLLELRLKLLLLFGNDKTLELTSLSIPVASISLKKSK